MKMVDTDSQLMDMWADAARRAGHQTQIVYPSIKVLREFYEKTYDDGYVDGIDDAERLSG